MPKLMASQMKTESTMTRKKEILILIYMHSSNSFSNKRMKKKRSSLRKRSEPLLTPMLRSSMRSQLDHPLQALEEPQRRKRIRRTVRFALMHWRLGRWWRRCHALTNSTASA
jgi:hypothetical protein